MRLDKFLSECGRASRKEAALAARRGHIEVNGAVAPKADIHIDPEKDMITFMGENVTYRRFTYIIMNKPEGYVSVTEAKGEVPASTLLPDREQRLGLFPAGRLDKSTTGLLLLTNDGETAHRLTSPKHHVEKVYVFTLKYPFSDEDIKLLESGVELEDGYRTMPCEVKRTGERTGEITLREGKYHQIKRMMIVVHNQITSLERIKYGNLSLKGLSLGEWRYLCDDEIKMLTTNDQAKGTKE